MVAGNIGDKRRFEYTVLGDTVNVASRIEALTREVISPPLVSDDLGEAVRAEKTDAQATLMSCVRRDSDRTVRGRAAPVTMPPYAGLSN